MWDDEIVNVPIWKSEWEEWKKTREIYESIDISW